MPTFVTTVGAFGRRVAARLAADPPSPSFAVAELGGPGDLSPGERADLVPGYEERLGAELERLLRAEATRDGGDGSPRLDLVLVADVAEVGGPILVALAGAMSEVLAHRFAVMFRPDLPADQRGVGLVAVLVTPALDASGPGQGALAAAAGLAEWHAAGPPSPILDRVFLLPRQNEAMPLSDEDVERAAALFLATAYRDGLRHADAIRRRLGPPRVPGRLLDSLSVAAADVDVARLQAAFGWRSALVALDRLARQCEGAGAGQHVPELDVASLLAPVDRDRPGRDLAERAAAASPTELAELVRAVDVAEGDAVAAGRRAVRALVDERLGGDAGLTGFRTVTGALAAAAERLRAEAAPPAKGWLPDAEELAAAETEARAEAAAEAQARAARGERADDPPDEAGSPRPPGPGWTSLQAALLGAVAGGAAAAIAAVATVRAAGRAGAAAVGPTVKAAASAPVGAALGPTLAWGIGIGLLVAIAWALASLRLARRADTQVEEAEARSPAPRSARRRLLAGGVTATLTLRRRRAARALLAIVEDERLRLEALRGAVLEAAARARARLQALRVTIGDEPARDDHGALFEPATPLHRSLLPPTELPRLWERTRAVREEELWAGRLLERAYRPGGHRDDLPFAPGGPWERALAEQHAVLAEQGAFSWPATGEVLAAELRRFLGSAPQALRLGVRPSRPDGTPEPLPDAREVLIVVPPDGRGIVERILAEQPVPDASFLTGSRDLSRVLVLRTAGEFDPASLRQGVAR